MSIHVAKRLRGSTYENLCGRTIVQRRNGSQLNQEALRERWELFSQSHGPQKAAVTIEPTPTASVRPRKTSLDAPSLVRSNGDANGAATPDVVTVPIA